MEDGIPVGGARASRDAFRWGRQTAYRGTWMRSRLEAWFAAWLDRQGFQWDYEPDNFANRLGQYLPDFRIRNHAPLDWGEHEDGHANLYIEVKPYAGQVSLFEKASIIWSSEPTAHLLYASPDLFKPHRIWTDAPLAFAPHQSVDTAMVFSCAECGKTTICASWGSWRCLRCGHYDGNGHLQTVDDTPWWEDRPAGPGLSGKSGAVA